jgi:hypothetical protein
VSNIWIFQTGEPLHSDNIDARPMRAMNLANTLVSRGHNVVLWSSSFYHQEKSHRSKNFQKIQVSDRLEICLIPSPGYKSNVSIFRLIDHLFLALNLKKQLSVQNKIPDVAFVGYPPIESAFIMSHWLKKRNVPFLLDVKDQWPSIIVRNAPKSMKIITRILLSPYYIIAKKTMANSTGICAMSRGFVDWSLLFSKRVKSNFDFIAPLTSPIEVLTNLERTEATLFWSKKNVIEGDNCNRIIFVGSFSSRAFNFDEVFLTAHKLRNINCEFIICGYGELDASLRERANNCKNVKIIEWIDRPKIFILSQLSFAYIAPYINSSDFVISIPNKVIDALKLGLPLLSPLTGEVQGLIEKNRVGLSYSKRNSLKDCIMSLINDNKLQKEMAINAKGLYNRDFAFNKVYGGLSSHLEGMVRKNE